LADQLYSLLCCRRSLFANNENEGFSGFLNLTSGRVGAVFASSDGTKREGSMDDHFASLATTVG
jgi:hypothetical protein